MKLYLFITVILYIFKFEWATVLFTHWNISVSCDVILRISKNCYVIYVPFSDKLIGFYLFTQSNFWQVNNTRHLFQSCERCPKMSILKRKKSTVPIYCISISNMSGAPPWSNGSVLYHRTLPPMFEYRCGHIWRVFHLWLRSTHLAYHVHTSGRKTLIII